MIGDPIDGVPLRCGGCAERCMVGPNPASLIRLHDGDALIQWHRAQGALDDNPNDRRDPLLALHRPEDVFKLRRNPDGTCHRQIVKPRSYGCKLYGTDKKPAGCSDFDCRNEFADLRIEQHKKEIRKIEACEIHPHKSASRLAKAALEVRTRSHRAFIKQQASERRAAKKEGWSCPTS